MNYFIFCLNAVMGLLCLSITSQAQTLHVQNGSTPFERFVSWSWGTQTTPIENVSEVSLVYETEEGKRISHIQSWGTNGWFCTGEENIDWIKVVTLNASRTVLTITLKRLYDQVSGHTLLFGGPLVIIEDDIARFSEKDKYSWKLVNNPSSKALIDFHSESEVLLKAKILNWEGRFIKYQFIYKGLNKLSLYNLPEGFYYIVPTKEGILKPLKWIKRGN